jgi:uncharacterized protein
MELVGEQLIKAPKQRVWHALNEPEMLASCLEGCQKLERTGPDSFAGVMAAKVGPVRATFQGKVTLSNIDAPNGYTITGEGQGGVAGFAKGSAEVKLSEADGGTLLAYAVKANVGGKLAQVGARLIEGVAKQYADGFFEKFRANLEIETTAGTADSATPSNAPVTPTGEPAKPGIPAWAWGLGLAGLTLLALYFLL